MLRYIKEIRLGEQAVVVVEVLIVESLRNEHAFSYRHCSPPSSPLTSMLLNNCTEPRSLMVMSCKLIPSVM